MELRFAGLIMVGLVVANFVAAKRFRYAANLESSETIVRQIFYVHCGYIVFIIASLALLCMAWPHLLLEDGMGRVLAAFFAIFWFSRVGVQLSYYDKELRARERGWDLFFLGVFLALAAIFTHTAIAS
ncbi:MAG: hypothetical protein R3242_11510 [Akkermansiaceae bacterium]|nr:hypothetical protein [Akkermansiaceae bacterium]